jgi:hypothetical protein
VAYNLPTVSDFKSQFPRDFPYAVPAWGAKAGTAVLAAGVIQTIPVTAGGQGYASPPTVTVVDASGTGATVTAVMTGNKVTSLTVGSGGTGYTAPTFLFIGGAGDDSRLDMIVDADIAGGITDAQYNGSQALFDTQASYARAFMYLAAHCMIEKIQMAGQGLASQYNWLTAAKGVGDVSSSFQIPEKIIRDPMLAMFSTTRYGAMYLQIISPLLVGNITTAHRQTLP